MRAEWLRSSPPPLRSGELSKSLRLGHLIQVYRRLRTQKVAHGVMGTKAPTAGHTTCIQRRNTAQRQLWGLTKRNTMQLLETGRERISMLAAVAARRISTCTDVATGCREEKRSGNRNLVPNCESDVLRYGSKKLNSAGSSRASYLQHQRVPVSFPI